MAIAAPTAHTYLHITQPKETFPYSEELSMHSYQGPKKPSPYLPPYLPNNDFQKIL